MINQLTMVHAECLTQPILGNAHTVLQGLQNAMLLCGAVIAALVLYEFLQRVYLTILIRKARFQNNVLREKLIALSSKLRDRDAEARVLRDICDKIEYAHKGIEGENVQAQPTAEGGAEAAPQNDPPSCQPAPTAGGSSGAAPCSD